VLVSFLNCKDVSNEFFPALGTSLWEHERFLVVILSWLISWQVCFELCCLSETTLEPIANLCFPSLPPLFLCCSPVLLFWSTLLSLSFAATMDKNCTSGSCNNSLQWLELEGCSNDSCNGSWDDCNYILFVATCNDCGKVSSRALLDNLDNRYLWQTVQWHQCIFLTRLGTQYCDCYEGLWDGSNDILSAVTCKNSFKGSCKISIG